MIYVILVLIALLCVVLVDLYKKRDKCEYLQKLNNDLEADFDELNSRYKTLDSFSMTLGSQYRDTLVEKDKLEKQNAELKDKVTYFLNRYKTNEVHSRVI